MAQFIDPTVITSFDHPLNQREIYRAIRQSIAAEHEAIHLYEAIADASTDDRVKKVMQDIADEEKVHASEFSTLLSILDPQEAEFDDEGSKEVMQLLQVSEDVEVELDGKRFMLEKGDKICVEQNG
ncbi:MAG: Rubrerythrin [Candidatus Lokiarchaeota archaeon]|nr:Rubrerythrin [Candidatus Lokiarchaeota archaeon]